MSCGLSVLYVAHWIGTGQQREFIPRPHPLLDWPLSLVSLSLTDSNYIIPPFPFLPTNPPIYPALLSFKTHRVLEHLPDTEVLHMGLLFDCNTADWWWELKRPSSESLANVIIIKNKEHRCWWNSKKQRWTDTELVFLKMFSCGWIKEMGLGTHWVQRQVQVSSVREFNSRTILTSSCKGMDSDLLQLRQGFEVL